jgi:hypothetical protein
LVRNRGLCYVMLLKRLSVLFDTPDIEDDSPVIMNENELKMQPTIHLERKAGYGRVNIKLYFPCIYGLHFQLRRAHLIRKLSCKNVII